MAEWKTYALLKAALNKGEPEADWAYSFHRRTVEKTSSSFGHLREYEATYLFDPAAPREHQRMIRAPGGDSVATKSWPGGMAYSGIKVDLVAASDPLVVIEDSQHHTIYEATKANVRYASLSQKQDCMLLMSRNAAR